MPQTIHTLAWEVWLIKMTTKVNEAEYLMEMARLNGGIACATVKDGHVLIFSKQSLMDLVAKAEESGKDQVVVFVKRNDMPKA